MGLSLARPALTHSIKARAPLLCSLSPHRAPAPFCYMNPTGSGSGMGGGPAPRKQGTLLGFFGAKPGPASGGAKVS